MAQAGPSRLGGSEPPGGGPAPLIRLRSKAPLPLFTCPHPIPAASSTIGDSLKLSVLRLLTGEVNERSSTAPMTESELLKLRTIHGWRMEMIALELRQNVLIAPETRDRIGEGVEDDMEGFELADDADCGLLEADDEVLIRLKPAFSLADLHLPTLAANHHYALPAGALTRAGTLSSPPPYSQVNVKRAAEPSSHSSSVQGQPNVNFHARQWRSYANGPRVVTAGAVTNSTPAEIKEAKRAARATSNPALAGPSRPLGLGMGVEPPAAIPSATTYKQPPVKQRKSKSTSVDQGPPAPAQSSLVPLVSPPLSANTPAPSSSAAAAPPPPPAQRKASASRLAPIRSGSATDRNASGATPPSPATASHFAVGSTSNGSTGGGADSMPLTALVIGPGVQGTVGRGSNAAMGHAGPAAQSGNGTPSSSDVAGDYGNAKAFASFTAAGGEVQHRSKPPRRQSSSHSTAEDKRKVSQHGRTRSQEVAGEEGGDAGEPARMAVEAAQKRAAAARAALQAAANGGYGTESSAIVSSPDPSAQKETVGSLSSPPVSSPAPVPKASRPAGGKERKVSSSSANKPRRERVELPEPPVLPPITNLAPFPGGQGERQRETLPPMPTPADVGRGAPALRRQESSNRGVGEVQNGHAPQRRPTLDERLPSSSDAGTPGAGRSTPTTSRSVSPVVVARRPSGNGRLASTGAESNGSGTSKKEGGTSRLARLAAPGLGLGGFGRKSSKTSVPKATADEDANGDNAVEEPACNSTEVPLRDADSHGNGVESSAIASREDDTPPSSAKLSKAERRYLDYQKQQQAEVSRQQAAERDRLAAMEREKREKRERRRKREEEERERKQKEKDEVWQEIRRRAAVEKEKEKERERAARPGGMDRKQSSASGVVAAAENDGGQGEPLSGGRS